MDKPFILIAEDSEFSQVIVEQRMKQFDYEFRLMENGQELIEFLKQTKRFVDLVLMDIEMPKLNGFEAIAIIRNELAARFKRLPVIAMTAHKKEKIFEKVFDHGFNDYIVKPFEYEDIKTIFDKYVENKTPAHKLKALNKNRLYNPEALIAWSDGDENFLHEMLGIFIRTTPGMLQNISEAIQTADWEEIRLRAHQFAPRLDFIGYRAISRKAEKIENLAEMKIGLQRIKDLLNEIEIDCKVLIRQLQRDFDLKDSIA